MTGHEEEDYCDHDHGHGQSDSEEEDGFGAGPGGPPEAGEPGGVWAEGEELWSAALVDLLGHRARLGPSLAPGRKVIIADPCILYIQNQ